MDECVVSGESFIGASVTNKIIFPVADNVSCAPGAIAFGNLARWQIIQSDWLFRIAAGQQCLTDEDIRKCCTSESPDHHVIFRRCFGDLRWFAQIVRSDERSIESSRRVKPYALSARDLASLCAFHDSCGELANVRHF